MLPVRDRRDAPDSHPDKAYDKLLKVFFLEKEGSVTMSFARQVGMVREEIHSVLPW